MEITLAGLERHQRDIAVAGKRLAVLGSALLCAPKSQGRRYDDYSRPSSQLVPGP